MNEGIFRLQCTEPGKVDEADYSAYYLGEARPEFIEHLAKCQFCRAEAAEYARLSGRLDRFLNRTPAAHRQNCPATQSVADYAFSFLKGVEKKQVENHLKKCPYCSAELEIFRAEISEPAELAIIQNPAPGAVSWREKLRLVLATLTPSQPQVALRGGPKNTLEYQAENITIVLFVEKSRHKKNFARLSGTVAREDGDNESLVGREVRLSRDEETVAVETIDEGGSFFFEEVLAQEGLKLEIYLDDKVVAVPDLPMNKVM